MSDDPFAPGADWDAEDHVRFLRAQGGSSSGYTADLIEKLHIALADERRHADALAEAVEAMDLCNKLDCEMRDNVLREHRARRQG